MSYFNKILGLYDDTEKTSFYFLGLKIQKKKKKSVRTLLLELNQKVDSLEFDTSILKQDVINLHTLLYDSWIKSKIQSNCLISYNDFIYNLFNNENVRFSSWIPEWKLVLKYYPLLFKKSAKHVNDTCSTKGTNILWGTQFKLPENQKLLIDSFITDNQLISAEMGFLHRIAGSNALEKYSQGYSFIFDDIAPYYDARFPNRLEMMLNDKNLIITEEQKQRARNCINKIIDTHLTKYNHQPIYTPQIGRDCVKKVLVVDQTYGDMSILKGFADDNTFKNMLDKAIKENPDADIIIKTHPDTKNGCKGYYTELMQHDNIYLLTKPINPISLVKYCDKVYVCTTQLGFESLMCGKEVHVFGMPFYAGWGLTIDEQKCERRTNKRTLEEIFYITYIMYSYYVNPNKNCICEIEEAMDYLLKLREEYFNEK